MKHNRPKLEAVEIMCWLVILTVISQCTYPHYSDHLKTQNPQGKEVIPMPEDKPMFSLPTCESYNPDGGKPRAVLRGPCPPSHMAKPRELMKPGPDHRMLGVQSPSRKATDHPVAVRCPKCNAKWYSTQNSSCTCAGNPSCPTKK